MRIGFFADDDSACRVAFLADKAFDWAEDASSGAPSYLAGGECIAEAVPDYLDAASARGTNLFVALPLGCVDDASIRSRLDLAVVTSGDQPLAVANARRAWEAELASSPVGVPPVWLLPCRRERRSSVARTLPVRFDGRHGGGRNRSARLGGAAAQQALGLAASLLLAAEDPYANTLSPEDLIHVLQGRTTAAGLALRDRLLELASHFEDAAAEAHAPHVRRRGAGGTAVSTLAPRPRDGRGLARRTRRAKAVQATVAQDACAAPYGARLA
ncbi:hypothetical protein [Methylorubrum thiocyanatum]|uniref:Uncharacterized protein n=1 Tax=Methylorubrum thiocyanatum TaxID=47958 RepID=A0AA40VDG6_9HYPH|nr:hypothetical protein [Methylorubrum thiocyanatum]MBA8914596.1 hypothetical protein [Methylorubrum thiocyanatum]GJE81991.1 hypothetical protein CJNNKLLH_3348 [Methylorubrum thiocyanatum]